MRLDDYAPFHAVHAELLAEAGDAGAAEAAWHRALAASSSDAQRDAMSERIRAQPSSRRVDGVG
jgi:predicted RNA polymerase sigma factor